MIKIYIDESTENVMNVSLLRETADTIDWENIRSNNLLFVVIDKTGRSGVNI